MYFTKLSLAAAALSSSVAAQTFSLCDPTRGDDCPPDPAFGKCNTPQSFDFTTVSSGQGWESDSSFNDWWTVDDGVKYEAKVLSIGKEKGAAMIITDETQAPLIKTKKYIFFGRVDVVVQAAAGQGIVTSVVLESDDRDEIDWEWIGGETNNVQTNFFSKGVNEFIHGNTTALSFAATEGLHTYSIDWTPEKMLFYVDGKLIRTATTAEAENGKKWPQTPTQIKLGTWVGGQEALPQGTIDWAGGLADFSQAPFTGYYQKVAVTDYCGGKDSAKEYVWGDSSGDASSIQVVEGNSDSKSSSSSSSATASSSKTTSGSATKSTSQSSKTTDSDASATTTESSASSASATASFTSTIKAQNSTGTATSSGSGPSPTTVTAGASSVGLSSAAAGLALLGFLML
ncbi:hypothetical protein TD95_000276 [Thielaviopsis punctulata]|uniref:GH16 domain-containing protein n=1 Tax=Thielaviopsis punctulata TaxID=72032 RepID=A0A0F4ZF81_9PEZI|nr:hypothetical protein TD95_000276 [Thielaviopsis punctulata]